MVAKQAATKDKMLENEGAIAKLEDKIKQLEYKAVNQTVVRDKVPENDMTKVKKAVNKETVTYAPEASVHRFKGAEDDLSNWAPCTLLSKDKTITYISLEQGYLHQKCLAHDEDILAETILSMTDHRDMKSLAKAIQVSPVWNNEKLDIMKDLLIDKFNQPKFRQVLAQTYPKKLLHNVADPYWGTGTKGKKGQNTLGTLLMDIRTDLKGKPQQTSVNTSPVHSQTLKTSDKTSDILIIGHSHLKPPFNTGMIKGANVDKHVAYTIDEAQQFIDKAQSLPKEVIFHLITNDVKDGPVSQCIAGMRNLVSTANAKSKSKIWVSLGIPTMDPYLNSKIRAVNLVLKATPNMNTIDHESSFTEEGGYTIKSLFWNSTHPNRTGLQIMADNWATALEVQL